jgi:Flp pilus assembly protein TadD
MTKRSINSRRPHSKYPGISAALGCAYARAGKTAEARRILAQLLARDRAGDHLENLHFVFLCAALGDNDQAFAWLQKAYDERDEDLRLLNVDPRFDRLRADPRFIRLQEEMRLSP